MISLILNENYETFFTIFNYLKININFNPKFTTIDFNKACFKAIFKLFPHIKIISCYYHLMKNCYKKIEELKYKIKKNDALDLISNIKNIYFVKTDNILEYFNLINNKYQRKFNKFINLDLWI